MFSKSFTRGVYDAFVLHGIPFTLESAQRNYMSAGCCKSNGAALLCSYARLPCDELKQIADHVCLPLDRGGISSLPDYFSL